MTTPTVDIIVVNWNGRDDTLRCLAAVEPQLAEVEGAVVTVVDNGSTDGSIAAITKKHPYARFLPLGSNRGFTGGIAAALIRSEARNVIFLNNDAVPEPGWLKALTNAIEESSEDVVSVGGRIIDLAGERIDFIRGVLTFDGHAFQDGFRMPIGSRPEPHAGADILFACGGNMITRRSAIDRLGGFDDDYFAYLEDVDFGWRTWIAGCRASYEPAAVVRHASSATSDRLGNFERGVLFERNALQTAFKNYEDLREASGAVLFTYLHRLHHYATTRNDDAAELTREALTPQPSRRRGFGRKRTLAKLDDPLTTMQFRALDWIFRNEAHLMEKRSRVQALRRMPDREIFARFPLHIVPTYPGDESLMAGPLFDLLRPRLPSSARKLGDIIRT